MARKRELAAAPAEIVPLSRAETNAELRENFKNMVAQMVDEQVREAMSDRGAELQPFFGSKEVAWEIKRRQTVQEQRKFRYFFEDWGCMVCGTKKAPHSSCGMCGACRHRVTQRLAASLRKRAPADVAQPDFMDRVRMARAAVAEPIVADETETTTHRGAK